MNDEGTNSLFAIDDGFTIVHKGESYAGASLRERVDRAVARLCDLGLRPGDRVAMCGPKSVDLCVLMLATWEVGAVAVPIFSGLKEKQVRHILDDSEPLLVFSAERDFHLVVTANDRETRALENFDRAGTNAALEESQNDRAALAPATSAMDGAPALIVYTSGSTGQPKGVVFSRANLVLGAKSVARFMRLTADDRVLCLLPFSFDAGLNQFLSALVAGAKIVLLDFVHASQVEACCMSQRITSITVVPGLWSRISAVNWRDEARLSVRRIGNTGGHLQGELLKRLQGIFANADAFLMYGFTEAFRATYLDPALVARKPHAVGRPIPYASVAVVSEAGRLCAPGEIGELVQFGPLVTLGYRNLPEANAVKFRALPEGLVATLMGPRGRYYAFDPFHAATAAWSGDLVSIDEDGDIVYRGRKDDLIKVNGFRVCPSDVEEAFVEAGFAVAIAVGITGSDEGGIVVFVKATDRSPDERAMFDRLRATLPGYMVPRCILSLDAFPLTANGKFDRQALRELASEQFARVVSVH